MNAANSILVKSEEKFAAEYHSIDKKIKEAREDGDTYTVNELKDHKEVVQEKYWAARKEREAMIETANKQKQEIENQQWNQRLQSFSEGIVKEIPDWNEDVALANRDFLIDRGIPQELIGQLVDVNAIKLVDDFRRFEQSRSKGAQKRQNAPVKAPPVKKGIPLAKKKQIASTANRDKVLSGQGSKADNDAFLRGLAAKHFD